MPDIRSSAGVILPNITYFFGVPIEVAEEVMSIYTGTSYQEWSDNNGDMSYSILDCTESDLEQLTRLIPWMF